uniref:DMT family transporter n=1 Tax=Ignisphaera aggregans TaxID=334771 RepID=A0A7C4FHV9_9CREN
MVRKTHIPLYVLASLSIGVASILVRVSQASPAACAFWRLFIASLLLLAVSGTSHAHALCSRKLLYPLVAGLALSAHFVLWMDSLFRVSVAVSTTIVVLYPVHLALVEVFRGEKVGLGVAVGIAMAFTAVVLLFSNSLAVSSLAGVLGAAEAFVASLAAAMYFYTGRLSRKRLSTAEYSSATYLIASLTTLAYSSAAGDNVFSYLQNSWPWLLALALVPMVGGHTVMNYLLKFYKSSTVTSIALAEPAVASILAAVILRERIGFIEVAALAMAIAGVALVIKSSEG